MVLTSTSSSYLDWLRSGDVRLVAQFCDLKTIASLSEMSAKSKQILYDPRTFTENHIYRLHISRVDTHLTSELFSYLSGVRLVGVRMSKHLDKVKVVLSHFKKLRVLDLSWLEMYDNDLTNFINSCVCCPDLIKLNLDCNKLTESGCAYLISNLNKLFPKIESLIMSRNNISQIRPNALDSLSELTHLRVLNISWNKLTQSGTDSIFEFLIENPQISITY